MKLPKKIKVGPHTITVQRKEKDGEEKRAGYFMCSENRMVISAEYPHTQQLTTFMHEVLHILNYNLSEEQVE